ncbi:hypothetical protein FHS43_001729 [Streptosporangium becharense]|uniref:Uncharacterized protein n=1 Tax=Streptosporangium becharense TaxID=1816182 RepID=A0A7W9IND8_9ACTN|nr:hypothetical protein [Streptosporangium becharense]MBB2910466.1 hypothetical protein [Streptosporangium becharense]MBB5823209.1 hypothetical protein [Streptosporangium becharense]
MAFVLQLQGLQAAATKGPRTCYSHVTSYNNTECRIVTQAQTPDA